MVQRPTAQILVQDSDRERVASIVERLGYHLSESGSVLVVDADLSEATDVIAAAAASERPPHRIVAYGRTLDDLRTMAVGASGAHVVVDAERFFGSPEEFLPILA